MLEACALPDSVVLFKITAKGVSVSAELAIISRLLLWTKPYHKTCYYLRSLPKE